MLGPRVRTACHPFKRVDRLRPDRLCPDRLCPDRVSTVTRIQPLCAQFHVLNRMGRVLRAKSDPARIFPLTTPFLYITKDPRVFSPAMFGRRKEKIVTQSQI